MMRFDLKIFQKKDYCTYKEWFQDEQLNNALGPIDEEWLKYVLTSKEGSQYCFWKGDQLLAVLGLVWGTEDFPFHTISDFAIRPDLRGKGLGAKTLSFFFRTAKVPSALPFIAHVMPENQAVYRFFSKLEWKITHHPQNKEDMYTFEKPN